MEESIIYILLSQEELKNKYIASAGLTGATNGINQYLLS